MYIQVFLIGPEGSGLSQAGIVDMIQLHLSKLSRDPYIKFGSGLMRDNRFNGVGGWMNRRIGCILIFSGLHGYLFQCLGCISFGLYLLGQWSEFFLINEVLVISSSSRVYCPCILGVEMVKYRISLASPLLALHGGWEAGTIKNHTLIMDTLILHTVS